MRHQSMKSQDKEIIVEPAYERRLISKSFFRYLGPVVLSVSFGQIAPLVDALCISRTLGEEALSAMGVVAPIYYVFNIIAVLFGIGIGVFIANEAGSGGGKVSARVFTKGFIWMSILSIIFSVAALIFREPFILFLRATPENITFVREYVTVLMIGGIFYVWNVAASYILTNDKNPKLAMAGSVTASVFNIIIDIVGMYFLGLGVWVAAFGTVFGMFISCIIYLFHFKKKDTLARFDFSLAKDSDPSIVELIRPGVFQGILYGALVIRLLLQNFILAFNGGTGGLGNAAVIQNLELVITILIASISGTIMPIAGAYNGEGNRCGTHMVRRFSLVFGYLILIPIFVVLIIFPNSFILIFVDDNEYMLNTLPSAVRISMVAFLFSMFSQIQRSYYASIGKEKVSMIAGIIQTVCQILSLIVLPVITPQNATWYALLVGTLASSIYIVVFNRGFEGVFRFIRGNVLYMTGDRYDLTALIDRIKAETKMILSKEEVDTLNRELLVPLYESFPKDTKTLVSFTILDIPDCAKTAIFHFDSNKKLKSDRSIEVITDEFCMMRRKKIRLS